MIFQPYVINPNTPPGKRLIMYFLEAFKYSFTEGEAMLEHLLKKFGPEGSERFTREGSKLQLFEVHLITKSFGKKINRPARNVCC